MYIPLMLPALLGLLGVLAGAPLTQIFTATSERRGRRLDALVQWTVASGRVVSAHEHLYEPNQKLTTFVR